MKKLVLILALAGMVGSVSAKTFTTLTGKQVVVSVKGDDDKDKKSKKSKKACKDGDGKCCSKDGEKKDGCCKDKQKAAEPAPAPATPH